jgi:hypothetical protein
MRFQLKLLILTGALALSAAPALAAGAPSSIPPANPGTAHIPSNQGTAHIPSTPGPAVSLPTNARGFGVLCNTESKQPVAGQNGSPFSACVTDMAKLASGQANNPRTACKDESKQHVAGEKGTAFSKCVSAGAQLLHAQSV